MESLLGYPHFRDVPQIHTALQKIRLPPHGVGVLKAGATESTEATFSAWSLPRIGVFGFLPEELCLFNKANGIMDIFHNIF